MISKHAFFRFLFSAPFLLCCLRSIAQTPDPIVGVWRGSSICQVKNSPCHNESVVYHISKTGADSIYLVLMNKMVNGKEEEMGTIRFNYQKKTGAFVSSDERFGNAWRFRLSGSTLAGTLVVKNNILYRIIRVSKSS